MSPPAPILRRILAPPLLPLNNRAKDNKSWELQSYMGYSYEAYATLPQDGDEGPDGWSGDVNTNVQVG